MSPIWYNNIIMLFPALMIVDCYQIANSLQQFVVYMNSSSEMTTASCWAGGVEIPCQNLEVCLKAARKPSITDNTSASELFVTEIENNNVHIQSSLATDGIDSECPTWMHYSNETSMCVCGDNDNDMVKCNATLNETYILDCHRMTYDDDLQQVIAGLSFYGCVNHANVDGIYHRVPANRSQINEVMCGLFNRDGRLCGACRDGYSPLVYSYQLHCKNCTNADSKYNWAKFVAVAFIPLTGFYIFVVTFKFNANLPKLHCLALFAQITTSPANIRIASSGWRFGSTATYLTKMFVTLYGIWNLDFFRTLYPDICLRLTTLQALSLDYVIAFYPLALIVITYVAVRANSRKCMWKPIRRYYALWSKDKDSFKTSMIDVFATFLLLSYSKILSVNFDLLAFTTPVNSNSKSVGRYLYYDASYEWFGQHHLPYGVFAILSFVIINLLPLLLLLFYPMKCFQRILNSWNLSHLTLHTFVDSFTGCYKDGTEPGTRDCRYFGALFLLIRILLYIVYQVTLTVEWYGWAGLILTGFTVLLIVAQPFKPMYKKHNKITTIMFGDMVLLTIALLNLNIAFVKVHQSVNATIITAAIAYALPQFYAFVICLNWVYKLDIFRKLFNSYRPVQKSSSQTSLLSAIDRRTYYTRCILVYCM